MRIPGACNPKQAHRALFAEPDIGLLLPCNVAAGEGSDVRLAGSFLDPVAVMQMTGNDDMAKAAKKVQERLQWVRSSLTAQALKARTVRP